MTKSHHEEERSRRIVGEEWNRKFKKRFEVIRILKLMSEWFLLADFEGILFGFKPLASVAKADPISPLGKQAPTID